MSDEVRLPVTELIGYTPEEYAKARREFEVKQEHDRLIDSALTSLRHWLQEVNDPEVSEDRKKWNLIQLEVQGRFLVEFEEGQK